MVFARITPRPARRLCYGTHLPPVRPGDKSPHVVKDVSADPAVPGNLLITTNKGVWTTHPDVKFSFPRRRDASTVDWRTRESDPTPDHLHVGDTLRPADDPPWETGDFDNFLKLYGVTSFDDLPEDIQTEQRRLYDDGAQEVTAVTAQHLDSPELLVTVYDRATHGTRSYLAHRSLPFTFPRTPTRLSDRLAPKGDGILKTYGPYIHEVMAGTFVFAAHPYGRGRWPGFIEEPEGLDLAEIEIRITRPPGDWRPWIFTPDIKVPDIEDFKNHEYARHPKDPRRLGS